MVRQIAGTAIRRGVESESVSAWSPHYLKDKELLERVQHRFTRMFKDLRQRSYHERLKSLNCGPERRREIGKI